eukprot:GGOE01049419.1.p1 GENE.GGOE01049419.1~~GGOE01049419.1.p1  ORF type:complete len:343 (+),score=115.38 GGOE01049419.1:100-1128(+)
MKLERPPEPCPFPKADRQFRAMTRNMDLAALHQELHALESDVSRAEAHRAAVWALLVSQQAEMTEIKGAEDAGWAELVEAHRLGQDWCWQVAWNRQEAERAAQEAAEEAAAAERRQALAWQARLQTQFTHKLCQYDPDRFLLIVQSILDSEAAARTLLQLQEASVRSQKTAAVQQAVFQRGLEEENLQREAGELRAMKERMVREKAQREATQVEAHVSMRAERLRQPRPLSELLALWEQLQEALVTAEDEVARVICDMGDTEAALHSLLQNPVFGPDDNDRSRALEDMRHFIKEKEEQLLRAEQWRAEIREEAEAAEQQLRELYGRGPAGEPVVPSPATVVF